MSDDNERHGRARERQRRRRERRSMVSRPETSSRRQASARGALKLPQINLPRNQIIYLIPLGVLLLVGVIFVLGRLTDDGPPALNNAIWLDSSWTHESRSDEDFDALVETLQSNGIGIVYAFVSSLNPDKSWSGDTNRLNRFGEVEPTVRGFVNRLRENYPNVTIYAWIEVATDLGGEDGYRLDDTLLHDNIGGFASRMIVDFRFDGVLLDAKPVWSDNDDLLVLLRNIRGQIGLDHDLAITAAPDLTPTGQGLSLPSQIAVGTMWSQEFKQRIALQVDQIVLTVYQSYQSDPVNYIEWVTYQVESYLEAVGSLQSDTILIVSVPDYDAQLPAHDPDVESVAGALDGVNRAITGLGEEDYTVSGIALYSDSSFDETDWSVYRDKWLNR